MRIAGTIDEVRAAVAEARRRGAKIVFVPTMGALHAGHLSLVRAGREVRGEAFVVLSVFVNPTQFGPQEDFDRYPRDLAADAALAESAGVDLVFAPSTAEMYPLPSRVRVEVTGLSDALCGRARPGHFAGVALVVTKLLNIVQPDITVLGQKDGQQAVVVRRLIEELNLPGALHVAPTVREEDGLAMSSRNRLLSAEDRAAAVALSRGLFLARDAWARGERDASSLVERARRTISEESRLELEYAEIVRLDDLMPWSGEGRALLAVAARAGRTRLIDNVVLDDGATVPPEERMTSGIAIILAAGEGKRMNSDLPKVLHEVAGAPLLLHVGRAARDSGADRVVVIVGKGGDLVRKTFAGENWEFVDQPERRGTGDAVRRAAPQLAGFEGDVLVLAGDVPLLEGATLAKLRAARDEAGAAVAVLTARIAEPRGYGRILRDEGGAFVGIVEEKDATPAQRAIDEVNSSVYCYRAGDLLEALPRIGNANAQKEFYLTDAVSILRDLGRVVVAVQAATPDEILGVNDPAQLSHMDQLLRRRSAPSTTKHAP